jgi:signal peptidase I
LNRLIGLINPRRLRVALRPFAAALLIALSSVGSLLALRRRYYRVEVAGDSMRPGLLPGDFLVLRRTSRDGAEGRRGASRDGANGRRGAPPAGRVQAGSIVALHDATGRLILKRVIGLPGESLRVGTTVLINRRPLSEPYAQGETPQSQFRGANQLAEEEYFLIGDNREASTDSRDFGAVRRERIEGTAVLRYWPLSRLGRIVTPARQLGDAAVDPELPLGMIRP